VDTKPERPRIKHDKFLRPMGEMEVFAHVSLLLFLCLYGVLRAGVSCEENSSCDGGREWRKCYNICRSTCEEPRPRQRLEISISPSLLLFLVILT